jgi:ABC-type multidrug transport system fused ATPase/permease subunit
MEAIGETKVGLKGRVGYVSQKSWSMSSSIEENIRFFGEDTSVQ